MRLKNINVKYSNKQILKDISLKINDTDRLVILGPSGSGKTTLLNIIAKNIQYEGEIENPYHRISYIFQDDRLLPYLTIRENVSLVCSDNDDIASYLSLNDILDKRVSKLSGGEKKRANILRAIAYNGDVILADEPFSGLDIKLRFKLLDYLKGNLKDKPLIMVSHDIDDAIYIANRIIILSNGKIVKEFSVINDDTRKEILDILTR